MRIRKETPSSRLYCCCCCSLVSVVVSFLCFKILPHCPSITLHLFRRGRERERENKQMKETWDYQPLADLDWNWTAHSGCALIGGHIFGSLLAVQSLFCLLSDMLYQVKIWVPVPKWYWFSEFPAVLQCFSLFHPMCLVVLCSVLLLRVLLQLNRNNQHTAKDIGPVCAWADGKAFTLHGYKAVALTQALSQQPPTDTTDTVASITILHRQACGLCSNPQDIEVYHRTAHNLTEITTRAGVLYALLGDSYAIDHMDTYAGLSAPCRNCWMDNIRCTYHHCAGLCLWHRWVLRSPVTIDGQLNDCLQCDDDHCGRAFAQCAGANRRRVGIVTDIQRQEGEVWERPPTTNWPLTWPYNCLLSGFETTVCLIEAYDCEKPTIKCHCSIPILLRSAMRRWRTC